MKLFGEEVLFLIAAFVIWSIGTVSAQGCAGQLSTELFFEDFGSGEGPGPSLQEGTTTYTYGSIGDGNYIVTNTTGVNGSLWHDAPDRTPDDVLGYCLLFDASSTPGIFYRRLFEDLCMNTDYTFSCYVANIVHPDACGGTSIEPNLKFTLLDPSTLVELGSVNTGNIATTNEMTWRQYSISFTTSQSQSAVLIEISNNAMGGCGNDLAIDDFSFHICNPTHEQEFNLCVLPDGMIQVGTETYTSSGNYETIIDIPNSCNDSIVYTRLTGRALAMGSCEESYFPNVFTPNYDGTNDVYSPYLSDCIVEVLTFQIFNRWGNKIYGQNNLMTNTIKWDGTYRSEDVPVGVYIFFLDALMCDGRREIYKGDITVLR